MMYNVYSSLFGFIVMYIKGRDIDPYRIPEPSASRINARWTNDEHLLAVQGETRGKILGIQGGDEYRGTTREIRGTRGR